MATFSPHQHRTFPQTPPPAELISDLREAGIDVQVLTPDMERPFKTHKLAILVNQNCVLEIVPPIQAE